MAPSDKVKNSTAANQTELSKVKFSAFDNLLIQIAELIERKDREKILSKRTPGLILLCLAAFLFTCALIAFNTEDNKRSHFIKELVLPADDWVVLYEDSPFCASDQTVAQTCLASPENPKLWSSPFRRKDKANPDTAHTHHKRVTARKGQSFWIGLAIKPEQMQLAKAKASNWLILGWVTGSYRIFIDGIEVSRGSAPENRLTLHLPISLSRMSEPRPLYVAVAIDHDAGAKYPDILARGLERFATSGEMMAWERSNVTIAESKPALLFGVNLALAGFFGLMWWFSKLRKEFVYMSFFALLHAAIQLTLIDVVYKLVGRDLLYPLDIVTRGLEGGLGLLLALAFARSSSLIVRNTAVFIAILSGGLALLASLLDRVNAFNSITGIVWVPFAFVVASTICLATARRLEIKPRGQKVPHRSRRLLGAAAAYILMALLYFSQAQSILGPDLVYAHRILHGLIVIFLVALLLRDISEQESIVLSQPIPKWHRQTPLPDKVFAAVTKADMKGSTRIAEVLGDDAYENFTNVWYTILGEEVIRNHGEVTFDEGDCIIGAIEHSQLEGSPVEHMLLSHAAAFIQLQKVAKDFAVEAIAYRAAIADGVLKPRWKNMLGIKRPSFASTGVLVDVSALMDLERELAEAPDTSRILIADSLVNLAIRQDFRDIIGFTSRHTLRDKRGSERVFFVWELSVESAEGLLNLASRKTQRLAS